MIAEVTRRLLFSSSLSEYLEIVPQAHADVMELCRHDKVTPAQLDKFCGIFELRFGDAGFIFIKEDGDFFQALWNRAPFGVSSCSNHVERIHRTCNQRVSDLKKFSVRLNEVIKVIQERFEAFQHANHAQAKDLLKKMKKRASRHGIEQHDECPFPSCKWGGIYTTRFHIPFPCMHTVERMQVVFTKIDPIEFGTSVPAAVKVQPYEGQAWAFDIRHERADIDLSTEHDATEQDTAPPEIRFLKQVTAEMIRLNHKRNSEFANLLAEISTKWGRTIAGELETVYGTPEFKAAFRVRCWLNAD
jgi:hypothetical protein